MWETFKLAGTGLASVMAVFTTLWFFGEPHADRFVTRVVDKKDFATKSQIDESNRKLNDAVGKLTTTRDNVIENTTTLKQILEATKEQRVLNNQILLELRSRQ